MQNWSSLSLHQLICLSDYKSFKNRHPPTNTILRVNTKLSSKRQRQFRLRRLGGAPTICQLARYLMSNPPTDLATIPLSDPTAQVAGCPKLLRIDRL